MPAKVVMIPALEITRTLSLSTRYTFPLLSTAIPEGLPLYGAKVDNINRALLAILSSPVLPKIPVPAYVTMMCCMYSNNQSINHHHKPPPKNGKMECTRTMQRTQK